MYMQLVTEYDVTNISGTQPRNNMKTMGKVNSSDLMMIITWSYKYTLSITYIELGQLITYNPVYCNYNERWSIG